MVPPANMNVARTVLVGAISRWSGGRQERGSSGSRRRKASMGPYLRRYGHHYRRVPGLHVHVGSGDEPLCAQIYPLRSTYRAA